MQITAWLALQSRQTSGRNILTCMTSQHYIDSYKPQCFTHNKHLPTLPGQQLNKTFLTCMTWQYYIGSYQFSVLLAQQIHTNITRTTVKQYISYVCLNNIFLTCVTWQHYIGSYQFSVLLAQQTHTNITRTTVKQYISYVRDLTLHWLVPILSANRTANTYQHYQDNS